MTDPPVYRDPLAPHSLTPRELTGVFEAQRHGAACLVWRNSDGTLVVRSLAGDQQRSWTIGRSDGMDIVIADPQVSRMHARLERDASEWAVVDLGMSRNGTFVNARRVPARKRLSDDDRIRLGKTVVAIRLRSETSGVPTVPGDSERTFDDLTPHQHRVLVELCRPLVVDPERGEPASNKQIAYELDLKVGTVKVHLSRVFAVLGLDGVKQSHKRRRAAADALECGVVTPADMTSKA